MTTDTEIQSDLRPVPCMLMRGGTSRGPFFLESDLPQDTAARDRLRRRFVRVSTGSAES